MSDIRVRPLSRARRWTWALVAVALAFTAWHGYGITVAPERPFFWIGVGFDVLVAVVAWLLGRAWPPRRNSVRTRSPSGTPACRTPRSPRSGAARCRPSRSGSPSGCRPRCWLG